MVFVGSVILQLGSSTATQLDFLASVLQTYYEMYFKVVAANRVIICQYEL